MHVDFPAQCICQDVNADEEMQKNSLYFITYTIHLNSMHSKYPIDNAKNYPINYVIIFISKSLLFVPWELLLYCSPSESRTVYVKKITNSVTFRL